MSVAEEIVSHGNEMENRELADAVIRAGGKTTSLTMQTGHSFQDHRIALAEEGVNWLQKLSTQ